MAGATLIDTVAGAARFEFAIAPALTEPVADAALVRDFVAAMDAFAPFEAAPRLAIGVSGGADSLALCLLADAWARARSGAAVALIVNHNLRPASAMEAAGVGEWMARRGIAYQILPWTEPKPVTGVQAAARQARYRLLCAWCRAEGVLHLLLGHHARDQLETVLFRASRASGVRGLGGMPAISHAGGVRLLRPLLSVDPARLRSALAAWRQPWIDDPSNYDVRFARTRIRALLQAPDAGAILSATSAVAAQADTARLEMMAAVVAFVARGCRVHPAGLVTIDRTRLIAAPAEVAIHALARLLAMVGGEPHECAADAIRRLYRRLGGEGETGATLGRCRLKIGAREVTVCRERRHLPAPMPIAPGDDILWDGRFRVHLSSRAALLEPLVIRPTSAQDLRQIHAEIARRPRPAGESAKRFEPPALAWPTLPILSDSKGVAIAPHCGYVREDRALAHATVAKVVWSPRQGLTGRGYFLG
ncbi:MAG: tRNA lysidine(34) synthetase TilS [Rhodospirillales bacterium]|nr:tRNA lysidine(34) synthetase TilS [Rhodospirillales bacterium]